MIRPLLTLPLVSLLALAACGTDPLLESPVRDIPGVILLDTGEEGEGQVPLTDPAPPAGFNSYGFWYTYHDVKTCRGDEETVEDMGETVVPDQGANFTVTPYASVPEVNPPPETLPNAPNNANALRISGSAHTYFGAGLGFKLDAAFAGAAPGVDFQAAGIVGVRFWATTPLGTATAPVSYMVKMQDRYSTPEAGLCTERLPYPGCQGPERCQNAAVATVPVTNEWRLYEVYFMATVADEATTPELEIGPMERGDWGGILANDDTTVIGPDLPPVPSAVYQLQFQTSDGSLPFDLWVDNFGFIIGGSEADNSAAAAAL